MHTVCALPGLPTTVQHNDLRSTRIKKRAPSLILKSFAPGFTDKA